MGEECSNKVFVDNIGEEYILSRRCPITVGDSIYLFGYRDRDGLHSYVEIFRNELIFDTGRSVSEYYMSILIRLSEIREKEGNRGMILDKYGKRFYYGDKNVIPFDHLGDKP